MNVENEFKKELNLLKQEGLKQNPLRIEYERKVKQLEKEKQKLYASGYDEEEIAQILHQKRRRLGLDYKKMAPPLFSKYIFDATEKKYGDPLGPDYESLRKKKTAIQIIESASRPIQDLDTRLTIEGFIEWFKAYNTKVENMNRYFRKAEFEEANIVYQMIIDRVEWMNEKGIHQWNTTDYLNVYPLSYYQKNIDQMYVLLNNQQEIICAALLFEQDERWDSNQPAYYIHNFVSSIHCSKAGKNYLHYVEQLANQQGKMYLRLDSADDNPKLTQYYESLGFLACGTCQDGDYRGVLRQKKVEKIEYLDVVDEKGRLTGEIVDRNIAHAQGIRHRAEHLWLVRKRNNINQILLQKRSHTKGSFPDCFDISSAGHVSAGEDFETSAIRELKEELGVDIDASQLIYIEDKDIVYDGYFHDHPFHDREQARVFILWLDLEEGEFHVDSNEVSEVCWIDLDECIQKVETHAFQHCLSLEGLKTLKDVIEK